MILTKKVSYLSIILLICNVHLYGMDIFQAARVGNNAKIKELITAGTAVVQLIVRHLENGGETETEIETL